MTIICDSKKRVTLPGANPGDAFDVQYSSDGSVVLRKLVPAIRRVKAVRKKNGALVLRSNTLITVAETLDAVEKHAL